MNEHKVDLSDVRPKGEPISKEKVSPIKLLNFFNEANIQSLPKRGIEIRTGAGCQVFDESTPGGKITLRVEHLCKLTEAEFLKMTRDNACPICGGKPVYE